MMSKSLSLDAYMKLEEMTEQMQTGIASTHATISDL